MNTTKYFMIAFMAMAVLAFSSPSVAPVFAEGNDHEDEGSDESYKVQQKVEIEQDCDQSNENDDSAFAILANEQACTAIGANVNDVPIEVLLPLLGGIAG